MTLTEQQEQAVVEYLKENPILYNRKLKEYKDKSKRDACWEVMAERIGISTEDIKKWFQSMRTVYGKVTTTKSGQAQAKLTDRQKCVKSSFLFLGNFIARIGKTTGLKRGNSATAAEGSDASRATSPEVEDTPRIGHLHLQDLVERHCLGHPHQHLNNPDPGQLLHRLADGD